MNLIEFISFVIAMGILTIIFLRRFMEARRRILHPEEFEAEEEDQRKNLEEFLRALKGDMEEDEKAVSQPRPAKKPAVPPPPPPKPEQRPAPKKALQRPSERKFEFKGRLEQYRPESAIEKRTLKTNIEDRFYESFDERLLSRDFRTSSTTAYDLLRVEKTPRIKTIVNRLPTLREMIIIKEVIGQPKCFLPPEWTL
jgi:hypothetical protein